MSQIQSVGFVLAAVVSAGLQPLVLQILRRRNVFDVPNERSSHTIPTPRGGGWGILVAVVVVVLLGWLTQSHQLPIIALLGCVVIAGVGGADDLWGLDPSSRLAWQVAVAMAIALETLGTAESFEAAGLVVVGVVAVVAYINAFNFMDGINGISAVSGVVGAGWLCILAIEQAEPGLAWLAAAVAGACAGFLPWNFPSAHLFLGDIGSYLVGALLSTLALAVWVAGAPLIVCLAPFFLYCFDTGATLLHRVLRGESVTHAHRDHLYQRMARRSGHVFTTLVVGALTLICLGAATMVSAGAWTSGSLLLVTVLAFYSGASRRSATVR